METVESFRPIGGHPEWPNRWLGGSVRKSGDPSGSGFLATLLAIAGHDLRQPLQVITSAHEVLQTMLQNREPRKELAQASDAAAQLARMLSQLVEAVHLQQGPREELRVPVRLRPILDELEAEFGEAARRKGLAFRVTSARGTALSSSVLLSSILRNLVRNAIDYTPPGGRVLVASRQCGPELRIEVSDTGIGIRDSALPTIFDAFQRVDGSRADGLGLGLFIVKRAADLLGHRVAVESIEGRGSRFTVIAPGFARETATARPNARL